VPPAIEARGRGILLLHDIQPATALALPTLLAELKARGYKIVHVVPATEDRPATVAETDDWVQRHRATATLAAGLGRRHRDSRAQSQRAEPGEFRRERVDRQGRGDRTGFGAQREGTAAEPAPLPRSAPWPNNVQYTVPRKPSCCPRRGGKTLSYYPHRSAPAFAASPERKTARSGTGGNEVETETGPNKILGSPKDPATGAAGGRLGHQLTVTKPTASISDVLRLGLR